MKTRYTAILISIILYPIPSCTTANLVTLTDVDVYSMKTSAKNFLKYDGYDLTALSFQQPFLSSKYEVKGQFISGVSLTSFSLSKTIITHISSAQERLLLFAKSDIDQFITDLKKPPDNFDIRSAPDDFEIIFTVADTADALGHYIGTTINAKQKSTGTLSTVVLHANPCPPCK